MKKVLYVASEAVPFIKTGGLADVVGSLPKCFPKEYFDELMSLPQGKGGNVVVHSHESQVRQLPVTNKTELMDIDTPADMARLS